MAALTDAMRKQIKSQLTAAPAPQQQPNRSVRTSAGIWAKPFASDALGVGVEQIPEARDYLRSHGIAAEFDKQGRCIVTSDKQYQDIAKALGMKTGRDGYQVKDFEGTPILTGRQQADGRRRLRQELLRELQS